MKIGCSEFVALAFWIGFPVLCALVFVYPVILVASIMRWLKSPKPSGHLRYSKARVFEGVAFIGGLALMPFVGFGFRGLTYIPWVDSSRSCPDGLSFVFVILGFFYAVYGLSFGLGLWAFARLAKASSGLLRLLHSIGMGGSVACWGTFVYMFIPKH